MDSQRLDELKSLNFQKSVYCACLKDPSPQISQAGKLLHSLEHLLGSWYVLESGQGTSATKVNKTRCLVVGSLESTGLKQQNKITVKYVMIIIYTVEYREEIDLRMCKIKEN